MRADGRARVEVTVPQSRRPRAGVELHSSVLSSDEVTAVRGIPVTTVPRTLLDLAGVASRREIERAIHEAEVLRLSDALSLADLLARYPRRRGAATIRTVLADRGAGTAATRSELEDRFIELVESLGLPRPEVNASLHVRGRWVEGDCVWRTQRVIVELDGRSVHGTARAFERDRERDRVLQTDGWRVVRVTWRQLHSGQGALAADLRELLSGV
jgi:hypothetical protein